MVSNLGPAGGLGDRVLAMSQVRENKHAPCMPVQRQQRDTSYLLATWPPSSRACFGHTAPCRARLGPARNSCHWNSNAHFPLPTPNSFPLLSAFPRPYPLPLPVTPHLLFTSHPPYPPSYIPSAATHCTHCTYGKSFLPTPRPSQEGLHQAFLAHEHRVSRSTEGATAPSSPMRANAPFPRAATATLTAMPENTPGMPSEQAPTGAAEAIRSRAEHTALDGRPDQLELAEGNALARIGDPYASGAAGTSVVNAPAMLPESLQRAEATGVVTDEEHWPGGAAGRWSEAAVAGRWVDGRKGVTRGNGEGRGGGVGAGSASRVMNGAESGPETETEGERLPGAWHARATVGPYGERRGSADGSSVDRSLMDRVASSSFGGAVTELGPDAGGGRWGPGTGGAAMKGRGWGGTVARVFPVRLRGVYLATWEWAWTLLVVYWTTLSIFPGFLAEDVSSREWCWILDRHGCGV